ncbi:iron ABC transporter permease [Mesorhizobium sp. 8]|uniref:ABC transporter permease n=1 Tax=Mesorhizobium sp. 8 TaxID=2584466 RepID=UPI0011243A3A|nr:iron ABC transporter permease [Mesorhizobium sp. 8]QDC00701.1 iron ABC transporter permease [Mesorhizobium sp. 8]
MTQAASMAARPGRLLSAWTGRRLFAAAIILVLALIALPPIGVLVATSLTDTGTGGYTLAHFATLFSDARFYASAWNSVLFSTLSTAFSVAFGGILAWVVVRTDAPLRWLAYVTAVVSLGTPYLLHVTAWLFFLGRSGPINEAYRALGGAGMLVDVNSMWGMVLIQGVLWTPLVFLLLSATFQRSNAEMEEAARMCGASVARTFWAISVRLAWPAVTGMALFVFIRNLESFDVPVLVGSPGRVYLLTTDIYLSMTEMPPKMGEASAFSLFLIAILSVLLFFYNRFSANADRYASVTSKGYRPRPFDLGRFRWLGSTVVLANFVLVLALPLLVSLWIALSPFLQPIRPSRIGTLTLANFAVVLSDPHYIELGVNTVLVASGAATAAVGIALLAAWLVVRRWPGGRVIEQLAAIPIVFPGIVVGVALIVLALSLPVPLYGTLALVALAFLIRFLPYGMRYTHTGILQIHHELEEAAAASGASQGRVLTSVVLPLLAPALASGWVFIFLLGANELSMSVLLAGANSQVMAVAMFERWSAGQATEVFALGLVWAMVMTVFMALVYGVGRRFMSLGGSQLK